jgi:hypothetical protein
MNNENNLYTYDQQGVCNYLSGSITQAAISTTAGILYSQLNLSGGILPGDINTTTTTSVYQFENVTVPYNFIIGSPSNGQMLFYNGSTYANFGPGQSGQVLTSQSTTGPIFSFPGLYSYETANPSSVSSFTMTGLSSGSRYKLILNIKQNTSAANILLQFNGDSGNNYNFAGTFSVAANNNVSGNGLTATSSIQLDSQASLGSSQFGQWEIVFETVPGNNNSVVVSGNGGFYNNTNSKWGNMNISGYYTGSSTLSSLTISDSAGTMTGTATLYQMN